jgi:superfamily II DNA or RNA helicase
MRKFSTITPDKDAKLLELKRMMLKLLSRKEQMVIFTYYADTLEYLADNLQNDQTFGNYKIEKISGKTPSAKRENIINLFFEKKIEVLISTDVLSEG